MLQNSGGPLNRHRSIIVTLLCTLLPATAIAQTTRATLAFPGAEGFGRSSTGGRGGDVVYVTNLNDSGPGSLRDAVSKEHRTVVFDVGGYIMLKSVLPVSSQITIAGQTAPGQGIGIAGAEVSLAGSHDLIIRFVRIRQGLSPGEDKKSAINMPGASNVIIDHVSVQWGRWDTIDMNLCRNITVQDCIIGPGVDPQRFGCLCQSDGVTFLRNLFISNQSRNPKAKGKIQYINNIVYNWGVCGLVGGHSGTDHVLDVIGNYFIAGPNSSPHALGEFTSTDHVYQTGNYMDMNRDGELNGRSVVGDDFTDRGGAPTLMPNPTVVTAPPLTADTAPDAYEKVLTGAGDSLHRDDVDERLIADVRSLGKTGAVIHDPAVAGGLGKIQSGPPTNSGNSIPADAATVDRDGYTTVEKYLNSLVQPAGR
jgi:pectate lyase